MEENNNQINFGDFEVLSEEDIKLLEKKLSDIENLTDEELNLIAGGQGDNAGPLGRQTYHTFLVLAAAALNEIRLGNQYMAIRVMKLILFEHRSDPIYINLREEFRKKFNVDPAKFGL